MKIQYGDRVRTGRHKEELVITSVMTKGMLAHKLKKDGKPGRREYIVEPGDVRQQWPTLFHMGGGVGIMRSLSIRTLCGRRSL